jgi:hypothetical protein
MTEDSDPLADPGDPAEAGAEAGANRGRAAAATIRTGVYNSAAALGAFIFTFLRNLLTLPLLPTGRLFKGLAVRCLYAYHKKSGGDRLGLVEDPGGKVDLVPVKYKTAAEAGDDTQAGWHAKGRDQAWRPSTLGQSGPRLGKVPIVPLDADSWRATSTLEARVAEAVDQGETRPLYRVDEANLRAELDTSGATRGNAVADGGQYAVNNLEFEPRTSPIFEDMIIDLGSDDYDGQAVSWRKTNELLTETTTSDEMERQEQRGLIAGMSRKDIKSLMLKVMLIGGVIAIAGLIGPELVGAVLGGGGGSGGGVIPI